MTPKPDVVIVHGAFHPPDLYSALKTKLEELGHTVVIPRLATLGESPGKTWKDDVAVIHEAVLPLFEQGHEVIIASHSYGGIPAAQAIEGFDVGSRSKQGKQGGFRAAVLMAAFAVPAGTDLYEATGKQYMSSVSWVEPYSGGGIGRPLDGCVELFFNDVPEEDANGYVRLLEPHSQDAFETKTTFGASEVPISQTFVIGEKDACFLPPYQAVMAASVPGMNVELIDAGHNAFISQPGRMASIISMAGA